MSVITGTVVLVDLNARAKSQKGEMYDAWKLIYTNNNGETKDITKHRKSLDFGGLREKLESLSAGDVFNATLEKNDKGFLEVKDISKGEAEAMPTAPKTNTTKSPYETPAERAARQVLIVRQSSLANAIAYYELLKAKPEPGQVIAVAKDFADWVFLEDKGVE